jgi:hypothetical protein
MPLKKQDKYKVGDLVSFYYVYEEKVGTVKEVINGKYSITSRNIIFTVNIDKISGKIIGDETN